MFPVGGGGESQYQCIDFFFFPPYSSTSSKHVLENLIEMCEC